MNRRSILGLVMGVPVGHRAIRPAKTTRSTVEGSMEPMPTFPLVAIIAIGSDTRIIKVITSLELLRLFGGYSLTDYVIKDMVYRNRTEAAYVDGIRRFYKLTMYTEVTANPDGTVTYTTAKGSQSDETMEITW